MVWHGGRAVSPRWIMRRAAAIRNSVVEEGAGGGALPGLAITSESSRDISPKADEKPSQSWTMPSDMGG